MRGAAVGAALLALVVLGFALRMRGIGHLLPTITQRDAATVVSQVEELRADAADPGAGVRTPFYPHLLARIVAVLPAPPAPETGTPADADEHLRRASAVWIQVRETSIALSMLLVPLTWLFARTFLGSAWALLPAAFVATSLLHVTFSAQERPHGAAASFMLLAVLAAMHLRKRPTVLAYLFAGVASGLAVGALHYGAFVLFAVLAAVLLVLRRARSFPSRLVHVSGLALALSIVALFFRWLYPFQFEGSSPRLRLQDVAGETGLVVSGHSVFLDRFRGDGFRAILESLISYDPLLLAATLLGIVALAFRLRRAGWRTIEGELRADALVAASFLLPFLLALGLYDDAFERFLLPALPYFATLAGHGLRATLGNSSERASSGRRIATSALACFVPVLALVPATHLALDRSSPDTLRCAAAWIRENVSPADLVVTVPYVDLPLLDADAALEENAKHPWASNWTRYQMRLRPEQKLGPRSEILLCPGPPRETTEAIQSDPIAYFRRFGARYVVLVATDDEGAPWWKARRLLLEQGRLVQRISCAAEDAGSSVGFVQRFVSNPLRMPFFLFVTRAARMGPVVEIFRIDGQR